jgi:hypothetical protein
MTRSPYRLLLSIFLTGLLACSSTDGGGDAGTGGGAGTGGEAGSGGNAGTGGGSGTGGEAGTGGGPSEWRIFRTATTQNADLGGIEGADAICAAEASAAGLQGEFKAWLSTVSLPVFDRVTRANGPYVLVDGTIVANGWDDLVDGSILAPINLDAGGVVRAGEVWTGTLAIGGASFLGDDCAAFTSGTTGVALCGATDSTTSTWTENSTPACSTLLGLYCIEQ